MSSSQRQGPTTPSAPTASPAPAAGTATAAAAATKAAPHAEASNPSVPPPPAAAPAEEQPAAPVSAVTNHSSNNSSSHRDTSWPAPHASLSAGRALLLQAAQGQLPGSGRILLVPDKDADGLCAAAIVKKTLNLMGCTVGKAKGYLKYILGLKACSTYWLLTP